MAKAEPNRAEQAVCRSLGTLLDRAATGDALWASDYDTEASRELLGALEFFLPGLLGQVHPFWVGESLDAFATVVARKTGDRSAELFGGAQLISDQRWAPFELELRLAPTGDSVEWLELRLGDPGAGKGGLDRTYSWRDRDKAVRDYEGRRDRIQWVFGISFDETTGPSPGAWSRGS